LAGMMVRTGKRGAPLRNFPNATGLLQTGALTCARKYQFIDDTPEGRAAIVSQAHKIKNEIKRQC